LFEAHSTRGLARGHPPFAAANARAMSPVALLSAPVAARARAPRARVPGRATALPKHLRHPVGAVRGAKRGVWAARAVSDDPVPRPPSLDEDPELDALESAVLAADVAAAEAREALARAVEARVSPSASADEADAALAASPFARVRCEYGYIQSNAGVYIDVSKTRPPGVPKNVLAISTENFARELKELRKFVAGTEAEDDAILVPPAFPGDAFFVSSPLSAEDVDAMSALRDELETLRLTNDAVWEREANRPEVKAPWIIKGPYLLLCYALDFAFPEHKPIQRFWFLETVARMPYFSYNTMLTLYELLGWWRRSSELQRVHFAEQWNEYQHLLVMESLGGDRSWRDRFLAQHAALFYFLLLCFAWLLSPALAYNFSELIEAHAVDTYAQFAEENKKKLRLMPAPRVAKAYWTNDDLYLFDAFQSARPKRALRRPRVRSLHDVFCAIRDDEAEHVATMGECQMENSAMADVGKVDLVTALTLATISANFWVTNFLTKAGGEVATELDLGEMLGEDGALSVAARLLSFLPFF
jgi:ubiquinol oxidase